VEIEGDKPNGAERSFWMAATNAKQQMQRSDSPKWSA